jgi:transposase
MLNLVGAMKIYLSQDPIDMRKGIDGLVALVQTKLEKDPFCGHLFVFLGSNKNRVKILHYGRGGFELYYKRLEKNRFITPHLSCDKTAYVLDGWQLAALLDGISIHGFRRITLWEPKKVSKGNRQSH